MTDLLSIGAAGVKAYTAALATIGDNIANSQTPGFVRRSIRTEEVPPGADIVLVRNQIRPGGVVATGVTRAVDNWLIEDSRLSESNAGRTAARLSWLEAAERALNDGSYDVGAAMTGVFNAADQLTANPSDRTLRSQFLQSVDDTAIAFRATAEGLNQANTGVFADAEASVARLNSHLTALSRINEGLLRARDASSNQASLCDERDRLLDQISSEIDISVDLDRHGAASLRLGAPSNSPVALGPPSAQFNVITTSAGALTFSLAGSGPFVPMSGKLAGLASAAGELASQNDQLNQLATQFATELNSWHQAGRDPQGTAGAALFDLSGGTAASLSTRSLRTDQVAAADGGAANGNMLELVSLRTSSGGEARWAVQASGLAQATASARSQDAAATTRRDGAQSARADISAVDLDHEAGELLRFQQAYQGSARILQVARETMQSILNAL
jgi:flagellar hook-associated protein 1